MWNSGDIVERFFCLLSLVLVMEIEFYVLNFALSMRSVLLKMLQSKMAQCSIDLMMKRALSMHSVLCETPSGSCGRPAFV